MRKEFSAILSELRRKSGENQRQAAAGLGISQALMSHYENGIREPKIEFLVKAADYYGVSLDYLLGRTVVGMNPFLDQDISERYGLEYDLETAERLLEVSRRVLNTAATLLSISAKLDGVNGLESAEVFLGTSEYYFFRVLRKLADAKGFDFAVGAETVATRCNVVQGVELAALASRIQERKSGYTFDPEALEKRYPGSYKNLMNTINKIDTMLKECGEIKAGKEKEA